MMITIEHINHQLDGVPILTDINLTLNGPGITAIIGPNGAGKSTLLSLMARLQPIQSGRILIDGADVAHTPSTNIARHLAILTQDNPIHSRINVRDLLMFGRYPHHYGQATAADHAVVRAALACFDLTDLADRYLSTLSGGQRQRALIAMVFCQHTPHVLLDEPLNNLDMFHARELMRQLRQRTDEQGLTTVMVVHDINVAAAWADHIVAMKDGHIVRQGAPDAIITPDTLHSVFQLDAEVLTHRGMPLVISHI